MNRTVTTEAPEGLKPRKLGLRVVTGVLYALVIVLVLVAGPIVTGVAFGLMAGFASAEFYAMQRREARLPNEVFGVAAATLMPIAAAWWGLAGLSSMVTALFALSLFWHVAFHRVLTADTSETIFGALYTGFLLGYLVLVRELDGGLVLSIALVASVWAADSFAYLVGSAIGRHKMVPSISPKKSWEGFLAGVVGSVLIWCLVPFVNGLPVEVPDVPLWLAAVTGLGVAVSSLVGDLAESRMKREAGVKDSGHALPGHGGFLDRLDSLIFACLVAYWILWWGGVR